MRRRRFPTRAEVDLWQRTMADVRPLRGRPRSEPEVLDESEAPPEPVGRVGERSAPPAAAPPRHRPPEFPELDHGTVAGVDRRTTTRMRRGRIDIEGRLDLHGMTQEEAHRTLNAFLARAQAAGKRCVLVITGKGRGAEQGGVLRRAVPRWLNGALNRPRVLAFDYASPKHGGEGALYVLLRKRG